MARERECHVIGTGTSSGVAQPPKDVPKMRPHKESLARLKEKISNKRILKLSRTNATVTHNLATKAKTRRLNVSSRQTLLASNKALALALEAEKHKGSMAISLMNEMRHTCYVQMLKASVLKRHLSVAEASCEEAQNVVATLQDLLVHVSNNNAELLSAGLKACALMKKVTPGQARVVENEFGASSAQALPLQIAMPQRIPVGMSRNEEEVVSASEKLNECSPHSPGPVATTARLSGLKLSFLDTTATEENERLPVALALEPTLPSSITSRRRKDLNTNTVLTIVNEETNVAGVTECKIPALEVDSFSEPMPNTSTTIEKTVYSQLDMEMTCDCSVSIEVIRTNKTENAKDPTLASVQSTPSKTKGTAAHWDEQENDKENGGRSRVRSKSGKIKSAHLVNKVLQAEAANKAQCNTQSESVAKVEKTRRARNVKYKFLPIGGGGPDDRAGDDDDAFDFDLKEMLYNTPFRFTSRVAVATEEEEELVPIPSLTMPTNKKCSASSTLAEASIAIPQQLVDRTNEATAVTGTPPAHGHQLMLSEPKRPTISVMPTSERRCRSLVNYKLPRINTKLRRGDEFTDAQFLSSPIYKTEKKTKKRQKRGARNIPQMSCFEEADVASANPPPALHCIHEYN